MLRRRILLTCPLLCLLILVMALPVAHRAQEAPNTDLLDVSHYQINGEIKPKEYSLTATTTVAFKLLAPARSVVLEMNGALPISKVTKAEGQPLEYFQDRLDRLDVRVDLGQLTQAGTEMKLIFEYGGTLQTPEGGPVADKRLAYISPEGSYLFYAARWFPFHKYASDLATYEINLTMPVDWGIAGYSQSPVVSQSVGQDKVKYSLVTTQPVLPGTLAMGNYITRRVTAPSGYTIEVFARTGDERHIDRYIGPISQMLEVYTARFGPYAFGPRFQIVEIDDGSMDYYVGPGALFIAPRIFADSTRFDLSRFAREVAYQWWGQAVALKTFDDAWLSQGLAQFSTLLFHQNSGSSLEYEEAIRQTMEQALTFESATSIARAPAELYDLSPSYISIVYYKGAFVYQMLRNLLGEEPFSRLLRTYYQNYKGKNASIADFEALTREVAGRSMRSFFGQWIDSTGVPEFRVQYLVLRTRDDKFKVRGTVKQEFDIFDMPVELRLRAEGDAQVVTVPLKGTEVTFEIPSETMPLEVVPDPYNKILHISDSIRLDVIIRRGIEHLKGRSFPEAEQEFRKAIEVDPFNSWAHYNLGLLFFEQRNYQRALDAFNDAINGSKRPMWVVVWSSIYRGNCYDALDERERAVAEYQKAIDSNDDYNNAQQVAQQYLSKPFEHQR